MTKHDQSSTVKRVITASVTQKQHRTQMDFLMAVIVSASMPPVSLSKNGSVMSVSTAPATQGNGIGHDLVLHSIFVRQDALGALP